MTLILQYLKPFNFVEKEMSSGMFENVITKMYFQVIYMYKQDLGFNNLQIWYAINPPNQPNYSSQEDTISSFPAK